MVLADDSGARALPVWLDGPEGHGLFRGRRLHSSHYRGKRRLTAGTTLCRAKIVGGMLAAGLPPACGIDTSTGSAPPRGSRAARCLTCPFPIHNKTPGQRS